ncbi:MAG: hypothetical protein ABI990_02955 [Actinomycetota bacterium]
MNGRFLAFLALIVCCVLALTPAAAAEPPTNDVPLDLESGVPLLYIGGLQIFNVYWDSSWDDPGHNPGFSTSTIDSQTQALADSNYFDKLSQYDVPNISFGGSATAVSFPCSSDPGDTTSSVAVFAFMLCEEVTPFDGVPLATGIPLPLPLVPNPTGHTIYNILLPRNTTIDDFGSKSCVDYGAYHFQMPSVLGFPIYFAVIPTKCASSAADLMKMISHEDTEAATDPLPLFHWIDSSTQTPGVIGFFSSIPGLLKSGEASDLCSTANTASNSPFGDVPVTLNGVSMNVATYWSNFDNACMVGPSRVVKVTFSTSGLSASGATLTVGGVSQSISSGSSVTMNLLEGTSFSFGDTPAVAGSRFRATGSSCSGSVTFPVSNTTANAAESVSCTYTHEFFLTVNTSPTAAATGNASLTPSGWHAAGVTVPLSADADVSAGAGSRYDFRRWDSGGSPLLGSSITLFAPATATAVYQLQHLVTFDETGIPAPTTWHVTAAGSSHVGPFSFWGDNGSTQSFAYQTPVPDASVSTTRYVLSGTSTPSPLLVTAPVNVVGTYATQFLLSVGTHGLGTNTTSVTNGTTAIGTATDATPATAWLPAGTPLALHVDEPVNGAGGIQYFFRGFIPVPPAALTSGFATVAQYEQMSQLIDDALASGGIEQQNRNGVAGALKQQWASVQADLAAGHYVTALNNIEAFVSHLAAQSGKKVTVATSVELRLLAAEVYHATLCQAVAAGQLNAGQHASRYAYYASLVTSLGGTPEPDC